MSDQYKEIKQMKMPLSLMELPREKLLEKGPQSLSDAELIAIFLRTGNRQQNVIELAHSLLQRFGSLRSMFQASLADFEQVKGVGSAKYAQVQACLELSRRYLAEQLCNQTNLHSSNATKAYLQAELKAETKEIFAILLLNNQHQVITFKRLFFGTINAAAVYPRVIVEYVLKQHAAAVILCHNHPSGVAEPSVADKQITYQIEKALALIDVNVLDHIIVAGHQCFSFAEHCLMSTEL